MARFEHYAVSPSGSSYALASVAGDDLHGLPDVLAALPPSFGSPAYLGIAADAVPEPGLHQRLHLFDTGGTGTDGPVPEALRPALERRLAELTGAAPTPAERAAWARPGWLADAEAWASCELRPHRIWQLSAVLRGSGGFLKAVFPLFHHEPSVTAALAREHPGSVPEVLRIDPERGWMLMRPVGGRGPHEQGRAAAAAVLGTLAVIHRAWSGRADELFALGAQDRRVHAPELALLPDTLVHGDFHGGNALVDEGRAVIFDWSDACVANPLFDLHIYLMDVAEQERDGLIDAYARGWAGDVAADDLRSALPHAIPLSCLHQAESYRAILASLAPDDRFWFEGEPERWRGLANAARAETRPSPDT